MPEAPAEDSAESPPPRSFASLRLVLVVMGFLLAAVLVAVAALMWLRGPDEEAPAEEDGRRLALPDLVASPHDEDFVVVFGGGDPAADLSPLDRGATLLVFARPGDPAGDRTARLAAETHRRLRERDVRVALVVPRDALPSGEEAAIRARLRDAGVVGDLLVVVDPADARGPGRFRRGRWHLAEETGALLLEDGVETMRVTPPSADAPLARAHLAPLVRAVAVRHGPRGAGPAPGGPPPPVPPAPPPTPPAPGPPAGPK